MAEPEREPWLSHFALDCKMHKLCLRAGMSAEGAGGFLGMKASGPRIGMSLVRRQLTVPPNLMSYLFSEVPPICLIH